VTEISRQVRSAVPRPSTTPVAERLAEGKLLREWVPRSSHAGWSPASDRPDSLDLLNAQVRTRERDLIPIRHGRMLTSPFAFYRGSAVVMATDLATTPTTGLTVRACGDAHLSNFGSFATPKRNQCLTSTTSTKPFPHLGNGTSRGWQPASSLPAVQTGYGRQIAKAPPPRFALTANGWLRLRTRSTFDDAIVSFAVAYANQTERDHGALVTAVKSGRIHAETGRKGGRQLTEGLSHDQDSLEVPA
jgi:hypothetical protein